MDPTAFDQLVDAYEATIDWPKRIANETPFYRWLVDRIGATSVLDVACGTGHHANLFHTWGLRVEGADLSPVMVGRCVQKWGESEQHRWSVRRFDQPVDTPALFDLAVCVGNSLALSPDMESVSLAIREMLAAVRVGGAIVVQVLNLWRLPEGQTQWQKCVRTVLPQGPSLVIKGVHRCGGRGFVNVLITKLDESTPPKLQSDCVPFLGMEPRELETFACNAGASDIEFFGGYDRSPFQRDSSADLIMLAIR